MNINNASKIKLFQLRALIAVAEHSNFSEAAFHLDLTQSAVSHAIASLENELGVKLFLRGKYGASLTPTGKRLISYANRVLGTLEEMVQAANREKGVETGQVRIASLRSLASRFLPPIIKKFQAHSPEVTITITKCSDYTDVQRSLRLGSADIGFMDLVGVDGFQTWELMRDEYVVLIPPSAKLKKTQLTWEEIAAYPLILPSTDDAGYAPLREYLRSAKQSFNIAYEVNEDSTIVSLVAQNLGAGILPRFAALPVPVEVHISNLPTPLVRVLGVAIPDSKLQNPDVLVFLDSLGQERQVE